MILDFGEVFEVRECWFLFGYDVIEVVILKDVIDVGVVCYDLLLLRFVEEDWLLMEFLKEWIWIVLEV